LAIDRRRLLVSAAAITSARIAPGLEGANAAASPDFPQSPQQRLEAQPRNFCATTARRLLEIARRNEIRREANLPLLSLAKELRRMKRQEELEEFSRFEAAHSKAVWDEVLKPRRETKGPNWRPNWMDGVRYQSEVYRILWEQLYAACRACHLLTKGRPTLAGILHARFFDDECGSDSQLALTKPRGIQVGGLTRLFAVLATHGGR
jgi:hypothetical protein